MAPPIAKESKGLKKPVVRVCQWYSYGRKLLEFCVKGIREPTT